MNDIPSNTVNGNLLNLADLNQYDIDLDDIATGLSNQCRYNGQVKEFYSVAEHCVLLCRFAKKASYNESFQQAILMHDAAEAYVGDVIRGLKKELPKFSEFEDVILNKIFRRFDIPFDHSHPTIKDLDVRICKDEMRVLQTIEDAGWKSWVFADNHLGVKIRNWDPKKAKKEFLKECRRLRIK